MKRIVKVLAATALMMVLMAIIVAPAFAGGYGPCYDKQGNKIPCGEVTGEREGVALGGHVAGVPNGWCSETYRYAYHCNNG